MLESFKLSMVHFIKGLTFPFLSPILFIPFISIMIFFSIFDSNIVFVSSLLYTMSIHAIVISLYAYKNKINFPDIFNKLKTERSGYFSFVFSNLIYLVLISFIFYLFIDIQDSKGYNFGFLSLFIMNILMFFSTILLSFVNSENLNASKMFSLICDNKNIVTWNLFLLSMLIHYTGCIYLFVFGYYIMYSIYYEKVGGIK
jgi:hypothetical protein